MRLIGVALLGRANCGLRWDRASLEVPTELLEGLSLLHLLYQLTLLLEDTNLALVTLLDAGVAC